ncbi:MAG: ATP-binding cassette domain-containing protein [Ruminococcaceae bacterium]|nr:ATP-binding cassette domain-containing protein [Oscillospiraceae bacterium]
MEITINKLSRSYGTLKALNEFTVTLTPGIYGLLGPNGAGKSTLMNIMTQNLKADSGDILVDGVSMSQLGSGYRELIGYTPQQQGMYKNMTVTRFMWYMAALKGMQKNDAQTQIPAALAKVNLSDVAYKKIGSLSGGMKQRLLIAQAILGDPKLLILDEPTAGLDPKERIRIRNTISEISIDKIVIIATHVVTDIEFISKKVILLKKGNMIAFGTPDELTGQLDGKIHEIITDDEKLISQVMKEYKVSNISRYNGKVYLRVLADEVLPQYTSRTVNPTLEDVYLSCFGDDAQ